MKLLNPLIDAAFWRFCVQVGMLLHAQDSASNPQDKVHPAPDEASNPQDDNYPASENPSNPEDDVHPV